MFMQKNQNKKSPKKQFLGIFCRIQYVFENLIYLLIIFPSTQLFLFPTAAYAHKVQ